VLKYCPALVTTRPSPSFSVVMRGSQKVAAHPFHDLNGVLIRPVRQGDAQAAEISRLGQRRFVALQAPGD